MSRACLQWTQPRNKGIHHNSRQRAVSATLRQTRSLRSAGDLALSSLKKVVAKVRIEFEIQTHVQIWIDPGVFACLDVSAE